MQVVDWGWGWSCIMHRSSLYPRTVSDKAPRTDGCSERSDDHPWPGEYTLIIHIRQSD